MLAITKGTTSYRAVASKDDLTAAEVLFTGDFGPSMVWDDELQNVRGRTAEELLADAKAKVTDLIRSEARRRILARIPDWMQANMTARAVQLVQLGQTDGAEWAAMQAAWGWVQATRQHSNDLTVKAVASDDPLAFDFSGGWPA